MTDEQKPPPRDRDPSIWPDGKDLGRYRVAHSIGRGGMGEVFLAHDQHLDRQVVLKVLRAGAVRDRQARQRLRREALALSRLNHPSIATIFDFDTQEDIDFIVMEHVLGETLAARLRRESFSEERQVDIGTQISSALAAAHRAGVLHRDLSPRNVMVNDQGLAKVLDFGLAKLVAGAPTPSAATETIWATQRLAGTVPYISPERLRGEPADERSDVYAMGAVLYEMAARRRVFEGDTAAELIAATLDREPTPVREFAPQISRALAGCIEKALDKNPAHRYQTARELGVDLERSRESATPPSKPSGGQRRLAALSILLVVVAAVYILRPGSGHVLPEATSITALLTGPEWEAASHISPDGKWVSYQVHRARATELWQKPLQGTEPRLLASCEGESADHDWSPDGGQIIFERENEGDRLLQIIPAFGGPVIQSISLPPQLDTIVSLRWTRSGVFVDASNDGLWRVRLQDGSWELMLPGFSRGQFRLDFDVSLSGERVVYAVREEKRFVLWTFDLVSGASHRLTRHSQSDLRPHFLGSDARYVVHTSNRSGQPDLWITDLEGRSRRLTFGGHTEYAVSSSHDGSRLLYAEEAHRSDLWIFDPARSDAPFRRLTGDSLEDLWPTVAPATGRVVFQRRARTLEEFDPAYQSQLLCARLGGDQLVDLRTVAPRGGMAELSTDGRWLAYARRMEGSELGLEVLDLETGHTRTVDRGLPPPMFASEPFHPWWTDIHWDRHADLLYYVVRDTAGSRIRQSGPRMALPPQDLTEPRSGSVRQPLADRSGKNLAYVVEEAIGEADRAGFRVQVRLCSTTSPIGDDRVLYEERIEGSTMLLLVGQRTNDRWLVLRLTTPGSPRAAAAFLEIEPGHEALPLARVVGEVSAWALDVARDRVSVVAADPKTGIQNLYQIDLGREQQRPITANRREDRQFADPKVLTDGRILYTRHARNSDVWLVEFEP